MLTRPQGVLGFPEPVPGLVEPVLELSDLVPGFSEPVPELAPVLPDPARGSPEPVPLFPPPLVTSCTFCRVVSCRIVRTIVDVFVFLVIVRQGLS